MFNKLLISLLLLFVVFQSKAYAESSYVLPYPPAMPGSFEYKIRIVWEKVTKYWYFGDFGSFSYNLKLSDKYLVQAKTLFEYKQYLLGFQALRKSNDYYVLAKVQLKSAGSKNGVDAKRDLFKNASLAHVEALEEMKKDTPKNFNWFPERSKPSYLELWREIDDSVIIRK